jgi:hypothetical protein
MSGNPHLAHRLLLSLIVRRTASCTREEEKIRTVIFNDGHLTLIVSFTFSLLTGYPANRGEPRELYHWELEWHKDR